MRRIWLRSTIKGYFKPYYSFCAYLQGYATLYHMGLLRLFFLALLCLPAIAHAQYTANPSAGSGTSNESGIPATCSPAVQGLMMNRAWMEAQRELEVGQMLLQQPTSVLSYSCFFDSAALPGAAMKFGKNAVGTIQAMLAGDQEPCIPMAAMWNAMKCANIDPETYFPTFERLAYGAPIRQCDYAASAAVNERYLDFRGFYSTAHPYAFGPDPSQYPGAGGGYGDVPLNFTDKLSPQSCAQSGFMF